MTDELHRVLPGYTHDDTFLALAAGLHVVIARFDELVAVHAPAGVDAAPRGDHPGELVDALLGAIVIRTRLAAAFAHHASATATRPRPSPATFGFESLRR